MRPATRALGVLAAVIAGAAAIGLSRSSTPPDFPQLSARLDRPAVRFISIHERAADVRLALVDGSWWLAEPVVLPANDARVGALLDAWAISWSTDSVAVAGPSRDEARARGLLDERVDLQFESEWETLVRVEVGEALPDGNHYVRLGGGRSIYEGPVPRRDLISPHVEDWLSPSLVAFAPDQLRELAVERGELRGQVMFEYGGETYHHNGVLLDANKTPRWLSVAQSRFAALQARPASDAQSAAAAASLAEPWLVALGTTERRGTFRLSVGDPVAGSTSSDRIARVEGDPTLYVLDAGDVSALLAVVPSEVPEDGVALPPRGPAITPLGRELPPRRGPRRSTAPGR